MTADRVAMVAHLLAEAAASGQATLAEHEAKLVLAAYGLPVTREILIAARGDVGPAAAAIGYPVALKVSSPEIPHKSEQGLVRLGLADEPAVLGAYDAVAPALADRRGGVLVQETVDGRRELAMGLVRDTDFGPCVMFALGGIFTEILHDAAFRRAPLDLADAHDMMEEIRGRRILDAARGLPPADRGTLAEMLMSLGQIGLDHERIAEIDLNPVILAGPRPVVVDALIVLR